MSKKKEPYRKEVPWWGKIPILGEILWNKCWVFYWGVQCAWLPDRRRRRCVTTGFFQECAPGGSIRHCWRCAIGIFTLRILTAPLTIPFELLIRWIWRSHSKLGMHLRWLLNGYQEMQSKRSRAEWADKNRREIDEAMRTV